MKLIILSFVGFLGGIKTLELEASLLPERHLQPFTNEDDYVTVLVPIQNTSQEHKVFRKILPSCDSNNIEIIPESAAEKGFAPGEFGMLSFFVKAPKKKRQISLGYWIEGKEGIEVAECFVTLMREPQIVLATQEVTWHLEKDGPISVTVPLRSTLNQSNIIVKGQEPEFEVELLKDAVRITPKTKKQLRGFIEFLNKEGDRESLVTVLKLVVQP